MAVNRATLRPVRDLARQVGRLADDTTRTLTGAWLRVWSGLRPRWAAATAKAAETGAAAWQIPRLPSVSTAAQATEVAMRGLAAELSLVAGRAAAEAVAATAAKTPEVIASQLPLHARDDAVEIYAAKVLPTALDVITARSKERITSLSRPLSDEAMQAVAHALTAGVAAGKGPNDIARDMLARVEGAFNGGLTRAIVIARTEVLSAHNLAAGYAHEANADVLAGWRWMATLNGKSAGRTCPACWAMHGTFYPDLATPGPLGHPQCRCTRVPVTRSWAELGIDGNEPADDFPDGPALFAGLPVEKQISIVGPARHAMLASGEIGWGDIAVRRENPGWRPSYVPASVRELRQIAEHHRANR